MKKITIVVFLILSLLAGCCGRNDPAESVLNTSTTGPTTEAGSKLPVVPAIDSFSSTELKIEKQYGSKIISATLKQAGNDVEVAPDDARLIRLLNLLTYSEDQGTTPYLKGLIEDTEIQERLSSGAPMLDIIMQPGPEAHGFLSKGGRIVICKDTYMIIYEGHVYYEGLVAEEFYPFGEDLIGLNMFSDDWGQEGWIDLLDYSGF